MKPHRDSKSAMILVIDRLGSGYLGPYGNTWIETPAFNHWASRSRLFENAISDTPSLSGLYQAYWGGMPAICAPPPVDLTGRYRAVSLPHQLADAGVDAALITDSPWLDEHPLAVEFNQRVTLTGDVPSGMAATVGQTQFGQMIAAGLQWLADRSAPSLLWLHAQACNAFWDAPFLLRDHFTEEGDPRPSECTVPPDVVVDGELDPDQLLAWTHAYAGHVVTIDSCLAVLQRALDDLPAEDQPLLIVTSPRGFALAEHGRIGPCGDHLYAELLQVPLLIREPHSACEGQRLSQLVQPVDLYATLIDYFELAHGEPALCWGRKLSGPLPDPLLARQYAVAVHEDCWSIRTPIWFFREDAEQVQLFAKPDDRWEVNEVASLCEDVVAALRAALAQVRDAAGQVDPSQLPVLADELVAEM